MCLLDEYQTLHTWGGVFPLYGKSLGLQMIQLCVCVRLETPGYLTTVDGEQRGGGGGERSRCKQNNLHWE